MASGLVCAKSVCLCRAVQTPSTRAFRGNESFFWVKNSSYGQILMASTKSSTTIGAGPTTNATPHRPFRTSHMNAATTRFSCVISRELETRGQTPRFTHLTGRAMEKATWVRRASTNFSDLIGVTGYVHTSSCRVVACMVRQALVMRIREQLCGKHRPLGART